MVRQITAHISMQSSLHVIDSFSARRTHLQLGDISIAQHLGDCESAFSFHRLEKQQP